MNKLPITVGIGVDLVNISRFNNLFATKNKDFLQRFGKRILHPIHELPRFQSLFESDLPHSIRYIAGSWSIKEALYKTLETRDQEKFNFNHWYRSYNDAGKPFISNDNYNNDELFLVSVSHDKDMLVANVLRQKLIDLSVHKQ